MKNLADGESNMIIFFELHEGKLPMSTMEYRDRYPSMVSLVLRLCKNYARTRRIVYGDAGFASVATLNALYDELELFFLVTVNKLVACTQRSICSNGTNHLI